jgi:hypothetical protein
MNPVSRISPISDADAARLGLACSASLSDLAGQITASPALMDSARRSNVDSARRPHAAPAAVRRPHAAPVAARPPRPPRARQRWLIAVCAAAAVTAAVVAGAMLAGPGKPHPGVSAPPEARAARVLSFTRHGRYIDVRVRNPVADPKRYRAEFRARGLNITLTLVPVSPSLVGTVVYFGGSPSARVITPITAKGRCHEASGTSQCPVGLRVPIDFRGNAQLVFGRAARPGEHYESTAPATAPGEVMHGMHYVGRTVAVVLAMLRTRHVTVPVFHYDGRLVPPRRVPGSWYVYDADPWAPLQVMLWVGPTRTQPTVSAPSPGTPTPSKAPHVRRAHGQ